MTTALSAIPRPSSYHCVKDVPGGYSSFLAPGLKDVFVGKTFKDESERKIRGVYASLKPAVTDGQVFACKRLRRRNSFLSSYQDEALFLYRSGMPDVRFIDSSKNSILMPLMLGGSLRNAQKRMCLLPAAEKKAAIRCIARQLIGQLWVCRRERILHGDIKPDNILIHDDGLVRLSDFGLSKEFPPETEEAKSLRYTAGYRAPEVCVDNSRRRYTFKADLWALGVTLIELAQESVTTDYYEESEMQQLLKFFNGIKPILDRRKFSDLEDMLYRDRGPYGKIMLPLLQCDPELFSTVIRVMLCAQEKRLDLAGFSTQKEAMDAVVSVSEEEQGLGMKMLQDISQSYTPLREQAKAFVEKIRTFVRK